jgi:hypothetical protein
VQDPLAKETTTMGKKRPDPNWREITELLWIRSEGFCEVSGRALDRDTFDRHHRRLKGMGGTYRPLTDSPCNLLALDPEVHNGAPWSVHQLPSWSRPRGYLLSAHVDDEAMAITPVLYRGKNWVILDAEGDFGVLSEPAQRFYWREMEQTQEMTHATRPRGSQYR